MTTSTESDLGSPATVRVDSASAKREPHWAFSVLVLVALAVATALFVLFVLRSRPPTTFMFTASRLGADGSVQMPSKAPPGRQGGTGASLSATTEARPSTATVAVRGLVRRLTITSFSGTDLYVALPTMGCSELLKAVRSRCRHGTLTVPGRAEWASLKWSAPTQVEFHARVQSIALTGAGQKIEVSIVGLSKTLRAERICFEKLSDSITLTVATQRAASVFGRAIGGNQPEKACRGLTLRIRHEQEGAPASETIVFAGQNLAAVAAGPSVDIAAGDGLVTVNGSTRALRASDRVTAVASKPICATLVTGSGDPNFDQATEGGCSPTQSETTQSGLVVYGSVLSAVNSLGELNPTRFQRDRDLWLALAALLGSSVGLPLVSSLSRRTAFAVEDAIRTHLASRRTTPASEPEKSSPTPEEQV